MDDFQRDRLKSYIHEKNLDKVKMMLVNEPSLIDPESFFAAAKTGDLEMVKYLVEYSRISLNEYDEEHRNVLHYAAESGNLETFRYLVEKCGMDPLAGDRNLVTPWDIAHNNHDNARDIARDNARDIAHDIAHNAHDNAHNISHETIDSAANTASDNKNARAAGAKVSDIEKYLENRYGHGYGDFYKNPIRSGFYPDPSICRVGTHYYMVNSSFIFFPCIPISHSTDLIHWEIIGHAITNPKWSYLNELEGGRGYWAPDISFYKGKFYITATYRLNDVPPVYRRQIVVTADKPEGPYSEPVFIDEDGIDPSIFNDDDGRRYMLLNRGARIFELDETGTKKISDAQLLFYGDHKRAPEGPHLYKKDGYYYLLEAEGGTGPGHRVTVSRSKELFGNYDPCPYNPIMRQEDEGAAIQRCGHGDMVETPDGRWYMVYLCGRMIGDGYSILGRETAIDPVTWTPDGWPIVNGLKGPSAMQLKPFPENSANTDEGSASSHELDLWKRADGTSNRISPCGLFMDYMTPRPFEEGGVICALEENNDNGKELSTSFRSFTIKGSKAPLSSVKSRNIVLRRQTAFRFRYEVTMEIPKLLQEQCAGITGYYDENTFFEFGILNEDEDLYVYSRQHIGDEDSVTVSFRPLPSGTSSIRLSMETDYLKRDLSYCISEEYTHFATLENVYYLCDEGLKKGKRFTGALVGMYAFAGESPLEVRFHHDSYEDLQ